MRVGIIAIQFEANTFLRGVTELEDFRRTWLFRGESGREVADSKHEVGGFFQGLADERIEAVPLLIANGVPGPVISADAFSKLVEMMLAEVNHAGPLDGLLVAPHGAAVAQNAPDMDGHWLSLLRQKVGPRIPIICTLDLHANVSQRMVDACDATISYHTNPHLDQRDRGIEAASLLARALRGDVRPTQAAAIPPIAINIERQLTRDEPCRALFALADEVRRRPGVLGASINLGFPYADVAEMGSSFIVVTDNDRALAQRYADELAAHVMGRREQFAGVLISVEQALDLAARSPRPAGLLDMGDNVGGGSAADGTVIAHALRCRDDLRGFVALYDPGAAAQAIRAGSGARIELSMGGKTDDQHGPPIVAAVTVRSVHPDARFTESQTRHGGRSHFTMGPTAIVQTDHGLTLQLTSLRQVPWSLGQLTSCGLDPSDFDVIVIKGVHAPVAAYEAACPTLIRVNTPGSTTADMLRLVYHNRRKPLFPFERDGGQAAV